MLRVTRVNRTLPRGWDVNASSGLQHEVLILAFEENEGVSWFNVPLEAVDL
jgi:hypothetical protein